MSKTDMFSAAFLAACSQLPLPSVENPKFELGVWISKNKGDSLCCLMLLGVTKRELTEGILSRSF